LSKNTVPQSSDNNTSYPTKKVIMYDTEINNSVFESLHGVVGHTIREFFIPSEKLIFNTDTGKLNVFEADWPREDTVGEYDVPKKLVDMVVSYFKLRQSVYAGCRDYQKDISSPTSKILEETE